MLVILFGRKKMVNYERKRMELNKKEVETLVEVFDSYIELMSDLSKGTLFTEEWGVYYKLKSSL